MIESETCTICTRSVVVTYYRYSLSAELLNNQKDSSNTTHSSFIYLHKLTTCLQAGPVQLVYPDPVHNTLTVDDDALRQLLDIDGPLAVVSVSAIQSTIYMPRCTDGDIVVGTLMLFLWHDDPMKHSVHTVYAPPDVNAYLENILESYFRKNKSI